MEFRTSIRADGLDPADDDDKPIEKQVSQFEDISVWAGTIKSNGQKIIDRVTKMQDVLETEVRTLDESVRALRLESPASY